MQKIIHNIETGQITKADMTPQEISTLEDVQAREAKIVLDELNKTIAKAALLERLGITADEAALLLS